MAKKAKQSAGRTAKRKAAGSTADKIDRELAASALRKRKEGKRPTGQELAALRRVERAEEERARWEHYASIPKKHWLEMSGRGPQGIKNHAQKHGFPLSGRTINLPDFVRYFHDFLAKNWRRFADPETDDEMLAGGTSAALEEYRRVKTRREELRLAEEMRDLIPREQVQQNLLKLSTILRSAGDVLQRQFGASAHQILDDALVEAEALGAELFDGDKKT